MKPSEPIPLGHQGLDPGPPIQGAEARPEMAPTLLPVTAMATPLWLTEQILFQIRSRD